MIFSIIIIFCAGEIQCKDYGIYPRDKGRLTVKGRVCQFPFSYRGVVYTDCAPGVSQPSPWCATSTKDDFSNTMMDWEICASVTSRLTVNGRVCEFPFSYQGVVYTDCAPGISQPSPWCATSTKDDFSNTVMDWEICASVTRVDDKFCKSLDYHDCKSEAIKRRCPQMCSAGVDDKFCKSLDYDDCKSEAIKRRCPQMCSAAVCDPVCVNGQCKANNKCSCNIGWTGNTCDERVDDKSCKSLDYDNCKSEAIKKRCPQMCSAGRWVWIDGRPFENFPWELGQPDDNQNYGGQDCLAWGWNSEFDDKNCFKENRYICELKYPWRSDNRCGTSYLAPNGQAAICNGGCCSPSGWCGDTSDHCDCSACVDYRGSKELHCDWPYERRGDECFFVSEDGIELLNWDDSRQKCLDMNGDLAMPHDMVDFVEYIKESYPDSKPSTIWLGATDGAVEQEWKWVSGESVPAEMWKPWPGRQPSGDGNCLEIHYHPNTDFYMNDWYCNKKGLYACEFELSGK